MSHPFATPAKVRLDTVALPTTDRSFILLRRLLTSRGPRRPVLLVHGSGMRSDLYLPPVPTTLPEALAQAGHDVWLLDWRASIDLPFQEWTLDDAAQWDIPAAVQYISQQTGSRDIGVFAHCAGACAVMLALCAGLLPEVTMVVANASAVHPQPPVRGRWKARIAVPVLAKHLKYLDPQWGVHPVDGIPRAIDKWVRLIHRQCDNAVCKHSSFCYGSGFPTLWRHQNLNEETHEWIRGEMGPTPLTFYQQMLHSEQEGYLRPRDEAFPTPFAWGKAPHTSARVLFLMGEENQTFTVHSMARSYDYFDSHQPDRHAYQPLSGYGHMDVIVGKNAAEEVFPLVTDWFERPWSTLPLVGGGAPEVRAQGAGVEFREVMTGRITFAADGAAAGYDSADAHSVILTAHVHVGGITRRRMREPGPLSGTLRGTVDIPRSSVKADFAGGCFRLFDTDAQSGATTMSYRVPFEVRGVRYELRGSKVLTPVRLHRMWEVTSTLPVELVQLSGIGDGRVVAVGTLRLTVSRFLALLSTLRGVGPGKGKAVTAFARFFVTGLRKATKPRGEWLA